jgi:hypothetical protein
MLYVRYSGRPSGVQYESSAEFAVLLSGDFVVSWDGWPSDGPLSSALPGFHHREIDIDVCLGRAKRYI